MPSYTALTLALATAAIAMPAPVINGRTFLSAQAIFNGTDPNAPVYLQGERQSVYSGSPAYLNYSGAATALDLDLTTNPDAGHEGIYGFTTPKLSVDQIGVAYPIFGYQGVSDLNWLAIGGNITHSNIDTLQDFFACEDIINGDSATLLSWGKYTSNGEAPDGCQVTKIIQNFNVEGGAKPPSS